MKQELNDERDPEMLEEYDFSGGVRGKYAGRFARGSNVVVLDPDVAQVFTDSESVIKRCVPWSPYVMAHEIKESDWKLFRRLHRIALERFCQRVIEEVRSTTVDCSDDYHDCYLKIFALVRDRDKEIAQAFNDPRRSNAFILLLNIKAKGLLTEEELMQFSPELREVIEATDRMLRA